MLGRKEGAFQQNKEHLTRSISPRIVNQTSHGRNRRNPRVARHCDRTRKRVAYAILSVLLFPHQQAAAKAADEGNKEWTRNKIFGLFGMSGTGKSTLVKMVMELAHIDTIHIVPASIKAIELGALQHKHPGLPTVVMDNASFMYPGVMAMALEAKGGPLMLVDNKCPVAVHGVQEVIGLRFRVAAHQSDPNLLKNALNTPEKKAILLSKLQKAYQWAAAGHLKAWLDQQEHEHGALPAWMCYSPHLDKASGPFGCDLVWM